MKKVLVLICLFCFCMGALAQEEQPTRGIEVISQKLDKANQALSRKLDKLNRKLSKKLLKAYPQLKGVNLDSLLNERVYQAEMRRKLNDSVTTVGDTITAKSSQLADIQPTSLDTLVNDSTWQFIQKIKAELAGEMELTPSALDIHQEMGESLAKLGKTEELLKQLQGPDLPELPHLSLPELPSVPNLNELMPTKYLEGLKGSLTDLGKLFDEYKEQFKGWDQKLLARATSLEEVKLLQEQKARMDAYKPLPEGYRKNMEGLQTNDFVKEKLQAKADEIAQVGGKSLQERFNEAQAKMDRAKEKFNAINRPEGGNVNQNPYKGKSLLKRLVLGGNLQVNRQDPTSLDAALQVSYLATARVRTGVGGSYRINLEKNSLNPDFDQQVFGTRSFVDYTLLRSFFLEAAYEFNNTDVLSRDNISIGRQWVQSGLLGIGNRFNLPKGIKGNAVMLYNFFHDERSPNPSPWVFRLGFEF